MKATDDQYKLIRQFGPIYGSTELSVNGHKLGDWIDVDFRPSTLTRLGFKTKRDWRDIIKCQIISIPKNSNTVILMTSSHNQIQVPLIFLPKKQNHATTL